MKIDYFTFNYSNSKSISPKQILLSSLLMLSMSLTFGQTITVETVSSLNPWNITVANPGTILTWNSTGAVVQVQNGNNVDFDFSTNAGGAPITVTTSGTPGQFNGIYALVANDLQETFPGSGVFIGQRIYSINLEDLNNLQTLNLDNNSLISIDISNNFNLVDLSLSNNGSITSLDVSFNPDLKNLDMENTSLSSVAIDNILNILSAGSVSGGTINFAGISTGTITKDGIQAYIDLVNRGWDIIPPQGFDRGDAPESYFTSVANNGPLHFFDVLNDRLRIGTHKDNDLNRAFGPGTDADGDDNDDALGLGTDEDGVDISQFDSFYHTDTNFALEVNLTNFLASDSYLSAWIDFDGNGTFDADEYAPLIVPANTSGIQTLTWDITALGADVNFGQSYVRIRYAADNDLDATSVGGVANGGEVEDYTFIMLDGTDTDSDGVPDITDVDDDNDGILDTVENNGIVDRDTDGDTIPDRIDLDSDGDGCNDVSEAGFDDGGDDDEVGTAPLVVDLVTDLGKVIADANGPIVDPTDAYGPPINNNGSADPDFQVAGAVATVTTEPTDQDLIIGVTTFSVVADADTYQWQVDEGSGFVDIDELAEPDYSGSQTADLQVTNSDIDKLLFRYQVVVSNSFYACDPETISVDVGYITPDDFDLDGIFDLVDVDDDNDGILDTVEDNGIVDRDTDGDTFPDRIDLDADGDGCNDVTEAGFDDGGDDDEVGTAPLVVDLVTDLGKVIADANGPIVDPTDAYGPPTNNNGSADPDFQVVGAIATITTEPTDQDLIIGVTTFSVVADADTYQWQVDDGSGFVDIDEIAEPDYSGSQTADLQVTNSDIDKLLFRYQVVVSNSFYVCDPTTISVDVGYITPDDFDLDGVFDVVDVDDDNDGILDTVEDNGIVDRDTDGNGAPDRIDLDADGDFCFDVAEAGFTDDNGNGILGNDPVTVDANGRVTSGTDGYTAPNDLNGNTIADFQEVGVAANITVQPVNEVYDAVVGTTVFSVTTDAVVGDAAYQWEESIGGVGAWTELDDGLGYSGTETASLSVPSPADYSTVRNLYRVRVWNVAYDCDPRTLSVEAGFIIPGDFDLDGVFDVLDVDDDNDGILDLVEDPADADLDTDGDGFPDRIDLDSDGDFCFDVIEAGFEENGRGELGNSNPAIVDANGQVISATDGYTTPNDLDGNGVPDFQEAGSQAAIINQPADQPLMPGNVTFSVVADADTYQWQVNDGSGFVNIDELAEPEYSGSTTPDLVIAITNADKYNYEYQVIVNNVAFACGVAFNSIQVGFIQDQVDTDLDGVFDNFDVDDDNDGIFDTVEGMTTDSNGNGIPDRLELDADGDLCFDVIEAGFEDNGQGELGNLIPAVVDANGQVISATDGYTVPADLDGNGIFDFQEAGSASAVTVPPQDITIQIGDDASFEVFGTATFYQWQLYDAVGDTWNNVVDDAVYTGSTTSELLLTSPSDTFNGNVYRVQLTSPDYICDPNPILNSESAVLNINVFDADNDGVPDAIDVDDDNDGILDVTEYDGLPPLLDSGQPVPPEYDTDNDGIANQFDLDSDDDFCFDVTEAGFTDNGSGLLGTQNPPVVDATGRVTSATDGYTTPNDLDGNGTPDFREFGVGGSIDSQPQPQDFVLNGSATFSVVGVGGGYQWQVSLDDVNWIDLADGGQYSGTSTANMTVSNIEIDNYFEFYRVILTNVALACDTGEISQNTFFNRLPDSDQDGVLDIIDVDDDNDGIFDTVEGEVTDTNLDGIPDRISLDSDSDGCADVREAGFADSDGDGILGISPVTVNAVGQVIDQQGGYTTPNDLDNNGVFDFQEAGEPSFIENQPEEVEIALGDDAEFEVSATATFYQWQQSMDGGSTWTDLVNDSKFSGVTTDRLRITDARGRLEGSRYRVVLTSPDFACDPVSELISEDVRLVFNTELIPSGFSPNGDGENDLFSVPGLIETPDFTMEVFDRWGNSVYKYLNNGNLNPDWWDGRSTGNMTLSKGQLVPAGTYFYLIQYNDGNKSPDKGWVYVNY